MTAATMTISATGPAPLIVARPSQTRKSIKKYFPLGQIMAKGNSNPITLHSVNEDVFPRLWSFMAEVMVAEGLLSRSTKEEVALMVSSKNQCPMCVTAHRMMGTAAKRAEKSISKKDQEAYERQSLLHHEAIDYAENLIDTTFNARHNEDAVTSLDDMDFSSSTSGKGDDNYRYLTEAGKVEVALVVLLYFHMNRVISAVLGEQMSSAMFSVPKSAAERMESASVMGVVNKLMAPFLAGGLKAKHKPGITNPLFPSGSSCLQYMPEHLRGAELAGEERAEALARLVAWVEMYEQELEENVVSKLVVDLLDDPQNSPPPGMSSVKIGHWATTSMRKTVRAVLPDENSQAVANVLLLVSYFPQSVFNSIHWITIVKALGADNAKTIVIWWSLRFTLKRSKGLRVPGTKKQHAGW